MFSSILRLLGVAAAKQVEKPLTRLILYEYDASPDATIYHIGSNPISGQIVCSPDDDFKEIMKEHQPDFWSYRYRNFIVVDGINVTDKLAAECDGSMSPDIGFLEDAYSESFWSESNSYGDSLHPFDLPKKDT